MFREIDNWHNNYLTVYHTYGLTNTQLMELFHVSEQTIKRWNGLIEDLESDDPKFYMRGPGFQRKVRIRYISELLLDPVKTLTQFDENTLEEHPSIKKEVQLLLNLKIAIDNESPLGVHEDIRRSFFMTLTNLLRLIDIRARERVLALKTM